MDEEVDFTADNQSDDGSPSPDRRHRRSPSPCSVRSRSRSRSPLRSPLRSPPVSNRGHDRLLGQGGGDEVELVRSISVSPSPEDSRSPGRRRARGMPPAFAMAGARIASRSLPERSRADRLMKSGPRARGSVAGLLGLSASDHTGVLLAKAVDASDLGPEPPPPRKACPGLRKRPRPPAPAVVEMAPTTEPASSSTAQPVATPASGVPASASSQSAVPATESTANGGSASREGQCNGDKEASAPLDVPSQEPGHSAQTVANGASAPATSGSDSKIAEGAQLGVRHEVDLSESDDDLPMPESPKLPPARSSHRDKERSPSPHPPRARIGRSAVADEPASLCAEERSSRTDHDNGTVSSMAEDRLEPPDADAQCSTDAAADTAEAPRTLSASQQVSEDVATAAATAVAPEAAETAQEETGPVAPMVAVAQEEDEDECMILEVSLPPAPLRIPSAKELEEATRFEEMRRVVHLEEKAAQDEEERRLARAARFGMPETAPPSDKRKAAVEAPLPVSAKRKSEHLAEQLAAARRYCESDSDEDASPLPEVILFKDGLPARHRSVHHRPPPPSLPAQVPREAPPSDAPRPRPKKMPRVDSRPKAKPPDVAASRSSSGTREPKASGGTLIPGHPLFIPPPPPPASSQRAPVRPPLSVQQAMVRPPPPMMRPPGTPPPPAAFMQTLLTQPVMVHSVPDQAQTTKPPASTWTGPIKPLRPPVAKNSGASAARQFQQICHQWQRKKECGFGANCKFLHIGPPNQKQHRPPPPIPNWKHPPRSPDSAECDEAAVDADEIESAPVDEADHVAEDGVENGDEAEATAEDEGLAEGAPGAYVDCTLLEELPDGADGAEGVEEDANSPPVIKEEPIASQEPSSTLIPEAAQPTFNPDSDDDALPDEEVQARLLEDAGLDATLQAAMRVAPNRYMAEDSSGLVRQASLAHERDEDDVFLDTIYES